MRRQLWKEHLGLIPEEDIDRVNNDMLPLPVPNNDTTRSQEDLMVMDPLDDETLARWNNTAATNTRAFREVFHCVPDDTGKEDLKLRMSTNMNVISYNLGRISCILSRSCKS